MAGNSHYPGRTVISKISAILLAVAENEYLSLTELAERTGLPLSTVHRLAVELADWQVLTRGENGRFRVGASLQSGAEPGAGEDVTQLATFRDAAAPMLDDLFRLTGCAVRAGVLDEAGIAYVEKSSSSQPVTRASPAARLPPHASALGKAILAFSPAQVVDATIGRGLTRYTPLTVTRPDRLRLAFRAIRTQRIAVCDRELDRHWSAIAAPVFSARRVVAALEVRLPDLPADGRTELRSTLLIAAASLSRELSHAHPAGWEHLAFTGAGRASSAPAGGELSRRLEPA